MDLSDYRTFHAEFCRQFAALPFEPPAVLRDYYCWSSWELTEDHHLTAQTHAEAAEQYAYTLDLRPGESVVIVVECVVDLCLDRRAYKAVLGPRATVLLERCDVPEYE